jgi:hypothetical protein
VTSQYFELELELVLKPRLPRLSLRLERRLRIKLDLVILQGEAEAFIYMSQTPTMRNDAMVAE